MRALVFIAALLLSSSAVAETLTMDLAEDHIDVTTGFTGAHFSVFGVKDGPGQVAVVITGPEREITVRKKEQVAGAWLNRTSVSFKNAPVYYDYAVSAEEASMASPDVLKANGVGLNSLPLRPEGGDASLNKEFKEALIRNNQTAKLYPSEPKKLIFRSPDFFRANFYLPANVHTGTYKIKTIYFNGGKARQVKTAHLKVEHVGASARMLKFSQEHSFSYGILCVVFALFAGWIANRIRRRT